MSLPTYTQVTVASGGTTSTTYETKSATRGSLQLPSAFTGTNLAFHGSNDGVTFTACPIEGNETNPLTTAGASGNYSFPVKAFVFRFLRLVVDAQAAARTITILTRD